MTDLEDVTSIAAAWVAALTARGVALSVRGRQLVLRPKSAYSAMSNEERATLKAHKPAIVALVREGYVCDAGLPVQASAMPAGGAVEPTVVPEPVICQFCMRAPCIGSDHAAYDTLHANDPELAKQIELREMRDRIAQLKQMRDPFGAYLESLSPEDRERELAMQRERRRIGWEPESGIGVLRIY